MTGPPGREFDAKEELLMKSSALHHLHIPGESAREVYVQLLPKSVLKHLRSENFWLGCSRFVTQFEHRRDQRRFIPGDVDRMLAQPVTLGVAQPLLRKINADVLLARVEVGACGH